MPGPFDRLVERQMLKAAAEGKLTGLAGEGQPLPDRSGEGDAALSAAMRVMAEAGVRPQEFDLKAQLDAARAAYAALTDPTEKKAAMARIADLDMRYTMTRDARRSFFR